MTKLCPENEHHDYYSSDLGWEYLGNDGEADYYVNHPKQWTSIVTSNQPWDYASYDYSMVMDGSYAAPKANQLRQFINKSVGE